MDQDTISRRMLLASSVSVGATLLSGCIFGSDSDGNSTATTDSVKTTETRWNINTPPQRTVEKNAKSEEFSWSAAVPDPIITAPTLSEDRIIVGTISGDIFGISTADGSRDWTYTAASDSAVVTSPETYDGTCYVGLGNGMVDAFDLSTRDRRWNREIGESGKITAVESEGDRIYTSWIPFQDDSKNSKLLALDAHTGEISWIKEKETITHICSANDTLYAVGERLTARSPEDGVSQWSIEFDNNQHGTGVTCKDSEIFVITDGDNSSILAATQSGTQLWEAAAREYRVKRPAVTSDLVISAADNDQIIALSRSDGSVVWTKDLGLSTLLDLAAPIQVDGDTVYVGTVDGIWALSSSNGDKQQWYETRSNIEGIVSGDRKVFASGDDGEVYAIGQLPQGQAPGHSP